MPTPLQKSVKKLRDFAFALPGAWDDNPWGESVAKVGKKVFVFMRAAIDPVAGFPFSLKLPHSGPEALAHPFAERAGYGLGKSGWVTFRLPPDDKTPADLFLPWIEESYRAVAPKKLVAQLDER